IIDTLVGVMIFAELFLPPARAEWVPSHIGGGGYIQRVEFTRDPRVLYTYVDVGGLYRSDDAGKSWRMLHGSLPADHYEVRGVSADARNAKHLLAAIGSPWQAPQGVFRSTDGGATFTKTAPLRFAGNGNWRWAGQVLARHPQNPDVVLAGTAGDGIWRSGDAGRTWKPLGAKDAYFTDIRFDPRDPSIVLACAMPNREWSFLTKADRDYAPAFWRSSDGGKSFRPLSAEPISEVTPLPSGRGGWIGIRDAQVVRSLDHGKSWQPFSTGLPDGPPPANSYTHGSRFQALATGPDFVLAGASDGQIYQLSAGTTRWKPVYRKLILETYIGRPWFRGGLGSAGWALAEIAIDPRNPRRWFMTDWYAIYQTPDAGETWQLSMDGVEATVIHSLAAINHATGELLMGMADNGAFRSEDGAKRFVRTDASPTNAKGLAPSPSDPRRVYATGPQGHDWVANQVYRSDDGGRTWQKGGTAGLPPMDRHRCNAVAVHPTRPDEVWLGVSGEVKPGAGGPYQSTDGGQTWTWRGEGLPTGPALFSDNIWSVDQPLAVGPTGEVLLVSGERGGAYFRKGDAWTPLPLPTATPREVYRWDSGFVIGMGDLGGVVRVGTDGVAKLFRAEAGAPLAVAPGRVIARAKTGFAVWNALDGWRVVSAEPAHRVVRTLAIVGDRAVAGTSGGGVFWMRLP
ncbi:MAG: hypothetical protein SFX74_13480, partial [Fimbriimonadaceae bacterium]|nr:hypothetical protein [Fimbriimonadaceae bacterium]